MQPRCTLTGKSLELLVHNRGSPRVGVQARLTPCAEEGFIACGRSRDRLGPRQVDAGLAQPGGKAGLPTDADGAAASGDECARRRVVSRRSLRTGQSSSP